jgi:hypothetical protein
VNLKVLAISDHDKYEWVSTGVLTDYRLAQADLPIAEALLVKESTT